MFDNEHLRLGDFAQRNIIEEIDSVSQPRRYRARAERYSDFCAAAATQGLPSASHSSGVVGKWWVPASAKVRSALREHWPCHLFCIAKKSRDPIPGERVVSLSCVDKSRQCA